MRRNNTRAPKATVSICSNSREESNIAGLYAHMASMSSGPTSTAVKVRAMTPMMVYLVTTGVCWPHLEQKSMVSCGAPTATKYGARKERGTKETRMEIEYPYLII